MHKTTIILRSQTRERLKKIGRKGESYDEVINQLIQSKMKSVDPLDSRFATTESSGPTKHIAEGISNGSKEIRIRS